MLKDLIYHKFKGKNVLILGFGKEGQSTYRLLRKLLPSQLLTIADKADIPRTNSLPVNDDENIKILSGEKYLDEADKFDYIIKSPGVSLDHKEKVIDRAKLSSQTDLFLNVYSGQTIGITGTKGKSTTASLIFHLIKQYSDNVLLSGNIGIPPFEIEAKIDSNSVLILELSAHQLEYITASPKTAVILNVFPEHLDYYSSFENYCKAKANITKFQKPNNNLIIHKDDQVISKILIHKQRDINLFRFTINGRTEKGCFLDGEAIVFASGNKNTKIISTGSNIPLRGEHNLLNIMAAINVGMIENIPVGIINRGIKTFRPLEHRLEYAGEYNGIKYYNDSISTVPQSTIQAIRSIEDVNTVIIGGYDRGIDYEELIGFIYNSDLENIIFFGDVGNRLYKNRKNRLNTSKHVYLAGSMAEAVALSGKLTRKGTSCLFSPAAASYDTFKNFEERGNTFKNLIKNH